jgi:hypothetical protein
MPTMLLAAILLILHSPVPCAAWHWRHTSGVVCALFGDRAVICFVAICDQITNDYEASMSHSNMNIKDKDIYLSSTEKKIINTVGMYISGF